MDPRVATVISLVGDQPASKIHRLAGAVRLSPSRLRHLFRAETEIALGAYIRQQRLQRAQALLQGSFMSVKEIAVVCGFSDSSHLVREFRRAFAVSPAAYRRAATASNR